LSVEAAHTSVIDVRVVAAVETPVGVDGGVVSAG
jgi:hypothetical protein